jgi:hypothetical protein
MSESETMNKKGQGKTFRTKADYNNLEKKV